VVSHGQNALVNELLADLGQHCRRQISLVLTQNASDSVTLAVDQSHCPTELILNRQPKGFGANHNAAFQRCRSPFFCVVNPDVRLTTNPFPILLDALARPGVGVVGPLVRNPAGKIEDSARRFPTLLSLGKRLFMRPAGPDYPVDGESIKVDWVAGMFMAFPSHIYRAVGGFDERYFLYYEDADICRRIRKAGATVLYEPQAAIVHDARHASRRNPRMALHHIASMIRFLSRA